MAEYKKWLANIDLRYGPAPARKGGGPGPSLRSTLSMTQEREPMLFDSLPMFPVALPDDGLRVLNWLPVWPTTAELPMEYNGIARRLERLGLIKVKRYKMDPCAIMPTWFAGSLPAATLRVAVGEKETEGK